jgi:hypothetical protein
MNDNIVFIKDIKVSPVDKVLREAHEQKFDEVIVFGRKEGLVHIQSSAIKDNVYILGCLEAMKDSLLKNWS